MTRRDAPATHRNRDPILEVLARLLTEPARVLEIASGTGQHAVYFAERLPHLEWQPSDRDDDALASIESWVAEEAGPNVRAPVRVDASDARWVERLAEESDLGAAPRFDAIFNANMIHISPWRTAEGLMSGAGRILGEGGRLFLYGPFRIEGRDTSQSNSDFDQDLRRRDPKWGVRDLEAVETLAMRAGLERLEINDLPANNKLIVFGKSA